LENMPKLMNRIYKHSLLAAMAGVLMSALLVVHDARGELCKWVDSKGVTHFAEICPEEVEAEPVEIIEPPHPGVTTDSTTRAYTGRDPDISARSQSLEDLGPPPAHTGSKYLQTTATTVRPDAASLGAQFIVRLEPTKRLQVGSMLEARFPDPANPGKAVFESVLHQGLSPEIRIASQPLMGFKCWNYHVVISVFSDSSKTTLLGTHEQMVQSHFDLAQVSDEKDFSRANSVLGNCPRARISKRSSSKESLAQLNKECERARERLLKPEREALIKRCKETSDKSDRWCEAYYSDYGAAQRHGDFMGRPKYWNIPECQAAERALMQNK